MILSFGELLNDKIWGKKIVVQFKLTKLSKLQLKLKNNNPVKTFFFKVQNMLNITKIIISLYA